MNFPKSIRSRSRSSSKPHFSVSSALFVIIFAGLGMYLLIGSHAATPYAATNADKGTLAGCATAQTDGTASDGASVVFKATCGGTGSGTTRYVATSAAGGSDSNACTQAAPCLSFDKAESVASPGDTVQVASGTYSGQVINNHNKSGANIVFTPAPGATVTINGATFIYTSDITFLGVVTNASPVPPVTNFVIQTVTIGNNDQTGGRINPDSVTLQNITGREFEIDSATNITINGGSWGPSTACGGPYPGNNNSIRQTIPSQAPGPITIENTVIHDIQSYNFNECHIEGLAIFAGSGVTVSNTKFYGNSVYDIFMQANSGGSPDNITLQNNWLAQAVDNSGANGNAVGSADGIALGGELSKDLTITGNHMNDIMNINDDGSIGSYKNVTVSNNYGSMAYNGYPCNTALPGVVWSNNVWSTGVKCGSTDTALNGPLPFVNHNNDNTLNYNLTN
jgi:hypothetical protein